MIAALLLAAGGSRRFGAPKLTQLLNRVPVVRWSAHALDGIAVELVVVVPPDDAAISAALDGLAARIVVNERAAEGMGTSLARGIAALDATVEAALVALGDEPLVSHTAHKHVLARFREGGAAIVASTYHGERGHPVLFRRDVFPELAALDGDRGARGVVDRDPARVAFVEMGVAHPVDVDTPDDLARLHAETQLSR